MNNKKAATLWSFWLIAGIALIWNVLGAINFLVQMNPEMLQAYRESERIIIENRPLWATSGFALAVFAGSLSSLLLLLKKQAAFYGFVMSLVGVIITMIHSLSSGIDFGFGEILGIILMPILVAVFLIWYAKWVQKQAWFNS